MDPDQPDPFAPPPAEPAPARAAPNPPDPADRPRAEPVTIVRQRMPWTTVLGFVGGLVGVAALGAAAWVHADTRREIVRLSTDIAQIRLSLELFNQQQGTAPEAQPENAALTDLANRLAILEQNWRTGPPSAPAGGTPPSPATAAASSEGDCLPTGTRFLVTAGDRYGVCGTGAAVSVASVDEGFITLADSTVIAAGGTFPLAGTSCMLGVVSAGPELAGYAEIRVTC